MYLFVYVVFMKVLSPKIKLFLLDKDTREGKHDGRPPDFCVLFCFCFLYAVGLHKVSIK